MLALVAVWAFAEATLFFIVVDLPISWIAVGHGRRRVVLAVLVAAGAAAAGGALTYAWAGADPVGARGAMAALPGIDAETIAEAQRRFAAAPATAMFAGAFTGIPYKLYALAAAEQGMPLLSFLLLSVAVRLPRFALIALVARGASRVLDRWLSVRARLALLASLWLAFYAFYFAMMPV